MRGFHVPLMVKLFCLLYFPGDVTHAFGYLARKVTSYKRT